MLSKNMVALAYIFHLNKTTFRNNEICEEYKERLGEKRLVKKLSKKYELSEAQILLIRNLFVNKIK